MSYTPPAAPPDHELAVQAVMRATPNMTEVAARRAIMASPPETVANLAAKGKEAWADEQTRLATLAYNTSPEGIRERAKAARLVAEQRSADLKDAETILATEQGLTAEQIAILSDEERLSYAGLPVPEPDVERRGLPSRMIREQKASPEELAMLAESDRAFAERQAS